VTTPQAQTSQVISMLRWLLIALFVVLGWIVLSYLTGVLSPVLAALGIAYLLHPVLDRMAARGVNRGLGAAILLISFIAIVVAAVTMLAPKVADQLAQFLRDLPQMYDNVSAWTKQHFDIELPSDWKEYLTSESAQASASGFATAALGSVLHIMAKLAESLLVPVFAFYFLVDWPNLVRRIDHMIPPRRRREVREIIRNIDAVVAGWVRGQAIVTVILAALYATGFTLVGMPLSLPIGLLVGLLTVIPFIGTFVGASIALLVTLGSGGSLSTVGAVAGVILFLHLLEAGVLTPKIVGHRVGLSETGALFAVVAGGKLLGFVGVVLAVPIAATTAVLVRYAVKYYEHTEFFGRESDADVVITPAMALIMPGVESASIDAAPDQQHDDWAIADENIELEPELGAAGAPKPEPEPEPEPEPPAQ
jgi:predicted PurR-regulated permease PerM